MADKIITGLDFQKRNEQVAKKEKEVAFEQLKSTIISIVNSVWEDTAGKVVRNIRLQPHLTPSEINFLGANEEDLVAWSKETLKLILFEDEDYGYELEVPEER